MLSIGLISLLIAVPLFSYRITPSLFNRITIITLIYSSLLAYNSLYVESLGAGVGIYSGLFHVTTISVTMESFLFMVGALAIIGWAPVNNFKSKIIQNSSEFTEKKSDQLHYASESSKSVIINKNNITIPFIGGINEYSIMVLFTTIGAALLVSSSDLISMYLSIELQSFAVYILATLYRDSESATAAGLKYFLLGGLSSALILLGTALIYSYTGVTQFESIYAIVSVPTSNIENVSSAITAQYPFVFGLTLIGVGFLFKVAAAPFHNWAPDVYNGVPTIVTTWLTTMPKISIFVFLLELQTGAGYAEGIINISNSMTYSSNFINDVNIWKNLLLVTSLFSLVIGTVVGLSQQRIKRLLAYSTISHVGFLLLALSINTEQSIESFLFYIIQYSITNVNTFIIILAFGYIISASSNNVNSVSRPSTMSLKQNNNMPVEQSITDIQFISELKGQFSKNPVLSLSFALCLFSIAGIPPLIGFFAKQMVLYSSTYAGYNFISIIAIIVSVISASYYLKIIKVMYFDNSNKNDISTHNVSASADTYNTIKFKELNNDTVVVSNVHSMIIAIITMVITLFVLQPSILLNSCHLLSLSLFNY